MANTDVVFDLPFTVTATYAIGDEPSIATCDINGETELGVITAGLATFSFDAKAIAIGGPFTIRVISTPVSGPPDINTDDTLTVTAPAVLDAHRVIDLGWKTQARERKFTIQERGVVAEGFYEFNTYDTTTSFLGLIYNTRTKRVNPDFKGQNETGIIFLHVRISQIPAPPQLFSGDKILDDRGILWNVVDEHDYNEIALVRYYRMERVREQ